LFRSTSNWIPWIKIWILDYDGGCPMGAREFENFGLNSFAYHGWMI
jgi:hypothetical protein